MAYTKQTYKDYPDTSTPITAERLNHSEQGIYDAHESISSLGSGLTTVSGAVETLNGDSSKSGSVDNKIKTYANKNKMKTYIDLSATHTVSTNNDYIKVTLTEDERLSINSGDVIYAQVNEAFTTISNVGVSINTYTRGTVLNMPIGTKIEANQEIALMYTYNNSGQSKFIWLNEITGGDVVSSDVKYYSEAVNYKVETISGYNIGIMTFTDSDITTINKGDIIRAGFGSDITIDNIYATDIVVNNESTGGIFRFKELTPFDIKKNQALLIEKVDQGWALLNEELNDINNVQSKLPTTFTIENGHLTFEG